MAAVWTFIWPMTVWLSQGSCLPVGEIGPQHPGLTAAENTVAALSPNELSMKRALVLLRSMESLLEQEAKDEQLEIDEVEVEASVGHLHLAHFLTTPEVLKKENEYNDGKANHSMSPTNDCKVSGNGTESSKGLASSGNKAVSGNDSMASGNGTDGGNKTARSNSCIGSGNGTCMVSSDDSMVGGNGYARGNRTDGNDGHMVSSNRTSIGNWTEDSDGKVMGNGHMIRGNGTHGGNGRDGSHDFMASSSGTDNSGINGSGHMAGSSGTATGNGTAAHDATEGPPEVPIRISKPPLSHAWPH